MAQFCVIVGSARISGIEAHGADLPKDPPAGSNALEMIQSDHLKAAREMGRTLSERRDMLMDAHIDRSSRQAISSRRPLWPSILASFSLLPGIVTAIPQFYYVLFALHLVPIGPNSNILGQIWYSYILNSDNSYLL